MPLQYQPELYEEKLPSAIDVDKVRGTKLETSPYINDITAEVSPDIGTLLVFRRSDHSWHGHLPFEGDRRVIQMNWVTEQKYVDAEQRRHKLSFFLKIFRNHY